MLVQPVASSVILVASAARYVDGNAYTTPGGIEVGSSIEGTFILKVSQGAGTYGNETLDAYIMSYDVPTADWDVIGQFKQVTNAEAGLRYRVAIPYGLGKLISCKWVIANCLVGEAYTFMVSGILK